MKILLFVITCLLSSVSFCQKGEYLVKNNGDTLWGDITLKDKKFYVNNATPVELYAEDVLSVKSDEFKGSTVVRCNLYVYTDNLSDLDIDYYKKGMTDTVLVLNQIYATPKMNLYYVQSNFKTPFYFYKTPNDEKPVQLVIRYFLKGGLANYDNDRAKYRGDKSRVTLEEDKGYANQLYALMGDCKNISEVMWEQLVYRDYSLKKMIKKYNACK